jgi:hypothetical protein
MAYATIARIINWPAEENSMISSDPRAAGELAGRVTGRSMRKQVKMAISALLFTTAFIFAAAPAAIAAEAVTNNSVASFWQYDPCRGQKPGVCPDYSFDKFSKHRTTLPGHRSTTDRSPSSP